MPAGPVPRSWRRYLRFRVRVLIVLVLLIGRGDELGRPQRPNPRDAVAAIKNAGGTVFYDWQWSSGESIVGGKPWAPEWLTDPIGVDYFGHVTYVRLDGSSFEKGRSDRSGRGPLYANTGTCSH